MRKLSAILVLIVCSTTAYSQKFSIGIRAGTIFNSAPTSIINKRTMATGGGSFLPGIKAAVDINRFQFGIGVDYGRYKYQYNVMSASIWGNFTMVASIPLTHPYLFANYKIRLPRSSFYTGVQAGYVMLGNKLNLLAGSNAVDTSWTAKGSAGSGISAGIQAGYILSLTNKWSIQAEAGARYMGINSTYATFPVNNTPVEVPLHATAWAFPITIGINYTF